MYSVWSGNDGEALEQLVKIHAPVLAPIVLDCTYNKGVIWKGFDGVVGRYTMDITHGAGMVTGDFTAMPFAANSFHVVVFDPPHLPTAAASENSSLIWEKRYGITSEGAGREGDNICGMFRPFLREAHRVLVNGGIVLAKLADIVHNHRYQWQMVDFVVAARELGLTPCDLMIKTRKTGLVSSKWKRVKHLRRRHSYWVVVRNSKRCES